MSIRALNWAYEQRLAPVTKSVLVALAYRLNDRTAQCNPSVETLAIMTGLSERGVQKALRELQSVKLIRHTGSAKGGRGKSTNWRFISANGRTPCTLSAPLKGAHTTGFCKTLKGERGAPDKEYISTGADEGASGGRRNAEKKGDGCEDGASPHRLRLVAGGQR